MKKSKFKKIIDVAWVVIFIATMLMLFFVANNTNSLTCLVDLVEKKDYYENFLWPALYEYVAIGLGVVTLTSGFIYAECFMDSEVKPDSRYALVIKNVSLVTTAAANVIFIICNIVCLKNVSVLLLFLLLVVIFAVISVAMNIKSYRESDDEGTIDEIWRPGSFRINILTVAILLSTFILSGVISKEIGSAKLDYNIINDERIELCFGHNQYTEGNRATVKVEFVNMYNQSGREYSMDVLEQEYTNYKKGEGSWSNLWLFCQDSIDIELKNQMTTGIYGRCIYDDSYRYLSEYYFPKNQYEDNYAIKELRTDKLDDIIYFTVCVEEELNLQGLTLRQLNDSADLNEDLPEYVNLKYETATTQQVVDACHSFAKKREPVDGGQTSIGLVESADFTMEVGIGVRVGDIQITEAHGYNISDVKFYKLYGTSSYDEVSNGHKLEADKKYKVSVYLDFPIAYNIKNNLELSLTGMEYSSIQLSADSGKEVNQVIVDIYFVTSIENDMECKGVEIGLAPVSEETILSECEAGDKSRYCDSTYCGWQVYDFETGTVSDYTSDSIALDNTCYIAMVKVTPNSDVSFEYVELVYLGSNINIYKYDEEKHSYKPKQYPKPYFVRMEEEGEEYLMAYIPYFQVYSTGVDGDLVNEYSDGNYVYLPEGAAVRFRDRPKLGYESYNYTAADFAGRDLNLSKDLLNDNKIYMPGYPITVTGYFQSK